MKNLKKLQLENVVFEQIEKAKLKYLLGGTGTDDYDDSKDDIRDDGDDMSEDTL